MGNSITFSERVNAKNNPDTLTTYYKVYYEALDHVEEAICERYEFVGKFLYLQDSKFNLRLCLNASKFIKIEPFKDVPNLIAFKS